MTAIKTIIYRGEDIYKETPRGLRAIEICSRLPLRAEIEAFQNNKINRDPQIIREVVTSNVFCKYVYFSKLTLNFRFAIFAWTENWIVSLNVAIPFVPLVVGNYFYAQCAVQN